MPRQVESRQPQGTTLLAWPAHRLSGRLETGVQTRPRGSCLTRVPACDPQRRQFERSEGYTDLPLALSHWVRLQIFPFPNKKQD